MYKKVSTNMNFVQREQEVLQFWTENKVFEQAYPVINKIREGKATAADLKPVYETVEKVF